MEPTGEKPESQRALSRLVRIAICDDARLMRTGVVNANLAELNEAARLPYITDLVVRKLAGPENLAVGQLLDGEVAFHESEYQRLRGELQAAHDASQLPELPGDETRAALNDLLVRIRIHGPSLV